ncbi:opsin-5 [Patella vulgata]|uniref:opsin-5 n=1 Tax=Patella vulgata TaxID=6465 RepID=UPI0024A9487B|nr:opsin-5 [Patella vulgata]
MILIVTLKRRKQLRYSDYYIINLAVCDIGHPLFGYPMAIIASFSHEWVFDKIGCDIYGYLGFQFGVGSMATLAVMAFVRYLTVCKPSSVKLMTWCHVCLSIVCIHLYAFLWAVFPFLGWGRYDVEPYGISCTIDWKNPSTSFAVATFIFCLGVPVVIMTTTYGLLIKISREISRKMQKWNSEDIVWTKQELYLFKMTMIMCGFFLLAWMPYAIVNILCVMIPNLHIPHRLSVIPALCAKASHTINPIIYFLNNKKLRAFSPSLPCLRGKKNTEASKCLSPATNVPTVNVTTSGNQRECKLSSE